MITARERQDDDLPGASRLLELDDAACLRLLGERSVGRMALTVGALPIVLPINYVLDRRSLVMATDPGLKLRSARARDVVCLEVDDWDDAKHSGWYVTVTGHLSEITDPAEVDALESFPSATWRQLDQAHHIRLTVELLQGRRLEQRGA